MVCRTKYMFACAVFFTLCELLTKRPFVYFPLLSTSY